MLGKNNRNELIRLNRTEKLALACYVLAEAAVIALFIWKMLEQK